MRATKSFLTAATGLALAALFLVGAPAEPSLARPAGNQQTFSIGGVYFHVYSRPEKQRIVVYIASPQMRLSEMDYLDDIVRLPPPPYGDFLLAAELYLETMPGRCRIERAQKRWEGEHWIDYSCRTRR